MTVSKEATPVDDEAEVEKRVFAKLEEMLKTANANGPGDVVVFDRREGEALLKWARIILAMETFGRMAGTAKTIAMWIGFAIGAALAFRSGLIDFIRDALDLGPKP